MVTHMRPAVTRLAAVCVWLFACVGAVQTPHVHAAGQVATDTAELQVFLDRAVPAAMQEWHVPGAVVLAVHGDYVVRQPGYGDADLDRQVRVPPEGTEFL